MMLPPDMEMWACKYLRDTLRTRGYDVEVARTESAELESSTLTRPLIIVRDDSGSQRSLVSYDRSLGVSVLGGTRQDSADTSALARTVMAIMSADAIADAPDSPVAAVQRDGCRGPYSVSEKQDLTRMYMTIEYTVIGKSFN